MMMSLLAMIFELNLFLPQQSGFFLLIHFLRILSTCTDDCYFHYYC